ncbi:MAG: CAP domain-containing protein [Anaerolineae bacterium]
MTVLFHRTILGLAALAVLGAALVGSHVTPADSAPSYEQQVLDLINQQRAAHGLPALTVDPRLAEAARAHNQLMAQRDKASHQLDGEAAICTDNDRLNAHGYAWTFCAENVAAGQADPQQVVNDWMNSEGHRENILNPNARQTGIAFDTGHGTYRTWWTQDFGAPLGGGAPLASAASNQSAHAAPAAAPGAALLDEGEQRQVMQFNPGAALQRRIFGDGFVPNSGEFSIDVDGQTYIAQRAEHLATGAVRVYYAPSGDWSNVGSVARGATGGGLGDALLAQCEAKQVMQFNPSAALQRRIFADGFVPNSGEFSLEVGGQTYVGQRAEHLGSGAVRVYYVPAGDWRHVQQADR